MLSVLKRRAAVPAPPVRTPPVAAHAFPLDMPLLQLSPGDPWTLRDACEGTLILGGTGAGKTSGSGQAIAKAFLSAGFGGLVLCAKPGEAALWQRYARETGREGSLIVFDDRGGWRFNFLDYELRRSEKPSTHNLVSLFLRIAEGARKGGEGGSDNPFWRDASAELLGNCFEALYAAHGRVTVTDLMEMINSSAQSPQEGKDPAWRAQSFCFQTLKKMYEQPAVPLSEHDQQAVMSFFSQQWLRNDPKTRANIVATVTSLIHPFRRGYLHELFCTTTNLVPELTHGGAVIVVDLPIKEHHDSGILAQHIWKYLWHRATERRAVHERSRPVFCFADECQFFLSEYDAEFQSTARSAKACTVYMTQNLPTVIRAVGGRHPEHVARSLLGNFQTKIFHSNDCPTTNQWASDIVGQCWQWKLSEGSSEGTSSGTSWGINAGRSSGGSAASPGGGSSNWSSQYGRSRNDSESTNTGTSRNYSQQLAAEVLPAAFTRLAKGGRRQTPEAIITQGGRIWQASRSVWLQCRFAQ